MNTFETVLVFVPNLDEKAIGGEIEKVTGHIKEASGSVETINHWGKKRLAYPIEKFEFGVYTSLNYEAPGTVVASLERQLQINEAVLRHITVKKDKFSPEEKLIAVEDSVGDSDSRKRRSDSGKSSSSSDE